MKKILTKKKPEKRLLLYLKRRAGRAKSGRVTVRHRGGGAKRLYRLVNFGQEKINKPGKVIALEYDPYRTAYLILLEYPDGSKAYQLAPVDIKAGDDVITSEKAKVKTGNRMKLKNIPIGTFVYNIEISPGRGGQIVRSAGTSAQVLAHDERPSTRAKPRTRAELGSGLSRTELRSGSGLGAGLVPHRPALYAKFIKPEKQTISLEGGAGAGYTHLKMPSKETRKILSECYATIGQISRQEHRYQKLRKAGQTRLKGRRPQVRGTAMSPRAHPHGGGEGRTPIGLKYPKTPWGKHALGVKTRKRKWTNKYIIKRRK